MFPPLGMCCFPHLSPSRWCYFPTSVFWVVLLFSLVRLGCLAFTLWVWLSLSSFGVALLPSSSFNFCVHSKLILWKCITLVGEEGEAPPKRRSTTIKKQGGRGHHSTTQKERGKERREKVAPPEREEGGKQHPKGRGKKAPLPLKKRREKTAPLRRRRESSTAHKEEEGENNRCGVVFPLLGGAPFSSLLLFRVGSGMGMV